MSRSGGAVALSQRHAPPTTTRPLTSLINCTGTLNFSRRRSTGTTDQNSRTGPYLSLSRFLLCFQSREGREIFGNRIILINKRIFESERNVFLLSFLLCFGGKIKGAEFRFVDSINSAAVIGRKVTIVDEIREEKKNALFILG